MVNVARKLNLSAAVFRDRIRQLLHLAHVRCFLVGSETSGASDYKGGIWVDLQNLDKGLYELENALLGIEASDKKDRLRLTNFFTRKEQVSIDSIEYDLGLSSQG